MEPSDNTQAVELGGEIRRVAILTVRLNPWARYLATRLRESGAELFLVNQDSLAVEPGSYRYFKRLYNRRGWRVSLDALLLHLVESTARAVLRRPAGSGSAGPPTSGAEVGDGADSADGFTRQAWLHYLEVANVNKSPDLDRLRDLQPDLILLAGAPILRKRTIRVARVACLNPHSGITPSYAGSSPSVWANYERRFDDVGFTVHQVVPTVDGGPVLHQERVAWDPTRIISHASRLASRGMYDKLADIVIDMIAGKKFLARPQHNVRVMPPAGLMVRILAECRRRKHGKKVAASRWRSAD